MVKTTNSEPKRGSKEKTEKTGFGAKGGSGKMFGQSGAAPQVPGVSNRPSLAPADKGAAKGGRTGVMGKQRNVRPSQPGAVTVTGSGGDTSFKASGGKGHMAGFSPASPAKAR